MIGVVVVLIVLAAATAFGLWRRRGDGALRDPTRKADAVRFDSDLLGTELGRRATLVQFSSAFCQPCRVTRVTLAEVARTVDGVVHVEIDAESHLDLVRRLGVTRTPTTFVLDRHGQVVQRATGTPRRDAVHAVLPA